MGKTCRLICSQLLVGFHIRIISLFGNPEFKLVVISNLYSIFSSISIRDVEAEAEAGSRSGPFSVEAEARKLQRFHIEGKNGEKR